MMRPMRILGGLAIMLVLPTAVSAAPPLQFELVMEPGFPLTDSQKWVQFLAKLEQTSIRIRQAEPTDRIGITNRGSEQQPVYHVLGILTNRSRLLLPGGEFSLSDREAMAGWIKKVEADGAGGPTTQPTAFGLTAEQLVDFHETLARPAECETKGRRCGDVARDLVKTLPLEFAVSDAARQAFGSDESCGDNLRGLSCGTALAAAIRPLGLVFRPEKSGNNVRLWIGEVREAPESWPIGWPPQETPGQTAPKLFESLNVEIKDVSLAKALDSIQPRVAMPFLYDYNGMLRNRIDPATVTVKYPKGRAMYRKILDNLLYQGKLSGGLRVDEAGNPFLWISPR